MLRTSEYWFMALRKTCICTRFITIQSAGKMFPIRSRNMWNVSIRKSWRKPRDITGPIRGLGHSGGGGTHDDVLPGLEGADVVSVVLVVHLFQDGRHAGQIGTLQQNMGQHLLQDMCADGAAASVLTMRGEELSMAMTVRFTRRRSRSMISCTWTLVGP